jgi:hypothetical protein
MGPENVHTMLKILSGHFYTRGAIEEMLAEQFGLPSKRTLDDIFVGMGDLEEVRVEMHDRTKYYGYFGDEGSPAGWDAGAQGKALLDEAKKERLQAMLRMVMQEVKKQRGKG